MGSSKTRRERAGTLIGTVAAVTSAATAAGCAMGQIPRLPPVSVASITSALPTIDPTAGEPGRVTGPPAEIYRLIASGAARCWFAPRSPLKTTHIFHADADATAKGGAVEIAVLVRETPKPWGPRAFRVVLTAVGGQTAIEVHNISMAPDAAALMRADAFHWAQDGKECRLKPPPEDPVTAAV
jgi:hypothetical protein